MWEKPTNWALKYSTEISVLDKILTILDWHIEI